MEDGAGYWDSRRRKRGTTKSKWPSKNNCDSFSYYCLFFLFFSSHPRALTECASPLYIPSTINSTYTSSHYIPLFFFLFSIIIIFFLFYCTHGPSRYMYLPGKIHHRLHGTGNITYGNTSYTFQVSLCLCHFSCLLKMRVFHTRCVPYPIFSLSKERERNDCEPYPFFSLASLGLSRLHS